MMNIEEVINLCLLYLSENCPFIEICEMARVLGMGNFPMLPL
jgi:hypothetical protein